MSENWSIQISPKLPDGTLINIRAESPEQLNNLLDYVNGKGADIAAVVQSLTAQGNVAQAFPGSQNVSAPPQEQSWSQQPPAQQGPPQWAQQQAPQQSAPAGPAPQCAHGQMTYRSGTKNGREWKAYFCPTPKGTPNQCEPQFIR